MFCFSLGSTAQIDLLKSASVQAKQVLNASALSKSEVAKGLKEALVIGADKAVQISSAKNGFYSNKAIRIPFPDEA